MAHNAQPHKSIDDHDVLRPDAAHGVVLVAAHQGGRRRPGLVTSRGLEVVESIHPSRHRHPARFYGRPRGGHRLARDECASVRLAHLCANVPQRLKVWLGELLCSTGGLNAKYRIYGNGGRKAFHRRSSRYPSITPTWRSRQEISAAHCAAATRRNKSRRSGLHPHDFLQQSLAGLKGLLERRGHGFCVEPGRPTDTRTPFVVPDASFLQLPRTLGGRQHLCDGEVRTTTASAIPRSGALLKRYLESCGV
jgi:hypothetical protein